MFRSVAFCRLCTVSDGDWIYETGCFSLGIFKQVAGMESRQEVGNEKLLFMLFNCNFIGPLSVPDLGILRIEARSTEKLTFDL